MSSKQDKNRHKGGPSQQGGADNQKKSQQELLRSLLNALNSATSDKEGKRSEEVGVRHAGQVITLPNEPSPMSIPDAIRHLEARYDYDEEEVTVIECIENAYPWDGARAFMLAMKELFGWTKPVPTPGFFGDSPPQHRVIAVDYQQSTEVIWGSFQIEGIDGSVVTKMTEANGRLCFAIVGRDIKQKHVGLIRTLGTLTRKYIATDSIYRGKAFALPLMDDGNEVCINYEAEPEFLNPKGVTVDDIILNQDVDEMIATNLYAPIIHAKRCRQLKVPLNRGVLLEGRFGVGKTMLAAAVGNLCRQHGWTFILCPKAGALQDALTFARDYQPAVVFAEDIDRAVGTKRTEAVDDILNTIDGVASKNVEILTVLTTNNVDNIHEAMLRPGRLDAIISIAPPDKDTAIRLVQKYVGPLLQNDEDLSEVGDALTGQIPAVIREVAERSKLSAMTVGRLDGKGNPIVTSRDLMIASTGMTAHLKRLHAPDANLTSNQMLANALTELVQQSMSSSPVVKQLATDLSALTRYVDNNR